MSLNNKILKEINYMAEAKSYLDSILTVYSHDERIACFYFDECVDHIVEILHHYDTRFTAKQIRHACDVRLTRFHRDVCCHINAPKYRRKLAFKLERDAERRYIIENHLPRFEY